MMVANMLDNLQSIFNVATDPVCEDMVLTVICNHFFLPCGSTDGVHRPLSLCEAACDFVAETCFGLWEVAMGQDVVITCNSTAPRFQGLSPCCSDFGIDVPTPPPPPPPPPRMYS